MSRACRAREVARRVEEAARILRITHLLDQPVSGLSSGDRQRVALGRAIVREPQAFMMDEPLGALDAEFRQLMCGELRALHDRLQATTVYVTHDQLEAMSMADTIAVMNHGVIEQLGPPQEIYDRPATMFVADFIGSPAMNFLPFEGRAGARRDARCASTARGSRCPRCARTPRRATWRWARAPSTSAPGDVGAARRGLRRRVPGHDADRHAATADGTRLRRTHRRRRAGAAPATRPACGSTPRAAVAVPTRAGRVLRARRRRVPRLRGRPMAELSSRRHQALRRATRGRATCRLPWRTASSSSCSGRPARARPRRCGWSPASSGPTPAACSSAGATSRAQPPAARDVAFVFQQYSLYPHLSVYDNLAFPLRSPLRRTPGAEIARKRARVAEPAAHRGEARTAAPPQLSGGQMQRVAIGRALVREPAVYLMDEPLSSLDAKLRAELRVELKRIQRELGATMLYVTHDQTEAMTLATRIGVLEQGALVQLGTPRRDLRGPGAALRRHAARHPGINLLPRALRADASPAPERAATIGVRTEHVRVRKAQSATARRSAACAGSSTSATRTTVQLAERDADFVTLTPGVGLAPGARSTRLRRRRLFFDAAGRRLAA